MPVRASWLAAGCIFVALTACGKDEGPREPVLAVDRTAVQFGQEFGNAVYVGTSRSESLLLQNEGGADLIIDAVELVGPPQFAVETPPPDKMTVPPGGHTFVRFTFTPEAAQRYTAIATIRSNAANAASQVVELAGTGVDPEPADGGM